MAQYDVKGAFARKYRVDASTGCWLWTASCGTRGYGQFKLNGTTIGAHVAAWALHNGAIPDGMRVCHRCDVTRCVNPAHLFLGTAKDNTQDMINKGRHRYATWNAPRGENHWQRRKHGSTSIR